MFACLTVSLLPSSLNPSTRLSPGVAFVGPTKPNVVFVGPTKPNVVFVAPLKPRLNLA
jgi:hypothetical protein